MGDPAGIGPELSLRVLKDPQILDVCTPVVFGDAGVLERVAQLLGWPMAERVAGLDEWEAGAMPDGGTGVVDCALLDAATVEKGRVQPACGRAAYGYIEAAIHSALAGKIAAVVTAPINKEALKAGGIYYPGHTEIFQALTHSGGVCMMLTSDEITVSMVTTHIGLMEVGEHLSPERVAEVVRLTAEALGRMLGRRPRLAVCGLNPHAGEHGLFGRREEERLILPGIEQAKAGGIDVQGPFPPDTIFVPVYRRRYDAVICMYHDQGHIPFKMLAFDKGVNITLGSNVIRTSVDHGTAFDIAWTGKADPKSLIQAMLWAVRLAEGER
ncbi:MAG: 4-hydroxythreonine-4-phosphate dehydrogenase PdxA [Acidobacteria bacterium]|nr:MAG: 4-hydroxythreonine-4-phosphate dehydrogenase PdxA [Acidobacteriota bacterium]